MSGRRNELATRAESLGSVPASPLRSARAPLMLASDGAAPFSSPDWVFQLKYDGFRMRAAKESGRARLFFRGGSEVTSRFAEVAAAIAALPFTELLLDGELIAPDPRGRPDFEALQRVAWRRQAPANAVRFVAFDVLALGRADVRGAPLRQRLALLNDVLPESRTLGRALTVEADGERLFDAAREHELEGIVAKRADSPYQGRRSALWRKLCVKNEATFRIVGLGRNLETLHVASDDAEPAYAGVVELGVPTGALRATERQWRSLVIKAAPCTQAPPRSSCIWLRPELRCRIRYKQRTASGRLRDPVVLGFVR